MIGQVRQQAQLLVADFRAAEAADARAWETFNAIASGLATVLTGVLVASAAATPPPAIQPVAPAQRGPRTVRVAAIESPRRTRPLLLFGTGLVVTWAAARGLEVAELDG